MQFPLGMAVINLPVTKKHFVFNASPDILCAPSISSPLLVWPLAWLRSTYGRPVLSVGQSVIAHRETYPIHATLREGAIADFSVVMVSIPLYQGPNTTVWSRFVP